MRHFIIRLRGFFKRKLVLFFNYTPHRIVSLLREEKYLKIQSSILCQYSDNQVLEIYDPRSGMVNGKYFQTRNIFEITNVTLEPKQGLLWANTSSKDLVKQSSTWHPYRMYSSFPIRPGNKIRKGNTIPKGISLTSVAFWHWLAEDLAGTIAAIEISEPSTPIILQRNYPNYVRDFLSTIVNPVIEVDGFVDIEKIIFTEKGEAIGWLDPQDHKILNSYFSSFKGEIKNDNYVYISRKKSKRSPANENEIEKLFRKYDFTILYMEDLNLFEQISIISSCSILAGVHGAGLSHLIWMSSGAKVLDIYNENYWTECFHRVAHISGVEYHHLGYKGVIDSDVPLWELENSINEILNLRG
jgi:hypothetical protein